MLIEKKYLIVMKNKKKKMIKIFFTDVDGTLTKNKINLTTSKKNILGLENLKKNNIEVVPITGLNLCNEIINFQKIFKCRYFILDSGLSIYDFKENKYIYDQKINKEEYEKIFNYILEKNLFFTDFNRTKYYFNENKNYNKEIYSKLVNLYSTIFINYNEEKIKEFKNNRKRIGISGLNKEEINDFMKELEKNYKEIIGLVDKNSIVINLVSKNHQKYEGAKKFCEIKNIIFSSEAASIGNDILDLNLLKKSSISFAVDNAIQKIKDNVTYIVSEAEKDGFFEASNIIIDQNNKVE